MKLKHKFAVSLLALSSMGATAVDAASKQVVSLSEYWSLQQKYGKTVAHMRYTPFPRQVIAIPLHSSVHGPVTVQFNTHTFIPTRRPDGSISLIPTIAVIPATHSGLGSYNNGDAVSVQRAMDLLAESPEIPTVETLRKITGDDHLDMVHGIDLFDVVNGRIQPGTEMKVIVEACKNELR